MMRGMRRIAILISLLAALPCSAAQLGSDTVAAFDRYVQQAERRIAQEQGSTDRFLWMDGLPPGERSQLESRLRQGEVFIERAGGGEIPHGLVHDWVGIVFIPHATVAETLARVQDYDHLARYFAPQVVRSQLLARHGNDFHVAMRLRQHKVVTVVLDTEYDVHYGRLDAQHWYSQSHSTRVQEASGDEHGFLWRLNSYWRFVQAPDGVWVQCEAISLTRDIPTGLGWLVKPFVSSMPRESLTFTLQSTRAAVTAGDSNANSPVARSNQDDDQ